MVATYVCGFFSLSLVQMVAIVTPLWGNQLGLSVMLIGWAAGARSVAPLVYSIHFGSLMDIIGVRRLMVFFTAQCALLPILYPLLPYGWSFLLLQLFLGLASVTAWLAAQVAIGRNANGSTLHTGWFSFWTTAGTVIGPLSLGVAWDKLGPTGGFSVLAAWGAGLFISSILLPRRRDVVRQPLRASMLVPRFANYAIGLGMLRRPIALFVISATFLRLGAVSMLESFYPLLLHGLGFSASTIGMLFAIGNVASSPSALMAGKWVQLCGSPRRALTLSVALSILATTALPWFDSFWQFAVASSVFGFGIGISMPLIFTLLSEEISPNQQGVAAGLRATANRLAAFLLPVLMGGLAELAGVGAAFWVIGVVLLMVLASVELVFHKRV